ncbi:MAG: hypothetical protein LEGION0398_MBIBDBAK_01423 [Legionellaceae bacterium]
MVEKIITGYIIFFITACSNLPTCNGNNKHYINTVPLYTVCQHKSCQVTMNF